MMPENLHSVLKRDYDIELVYCRSYFGSFLLPLAIECGYSGLFQLVPVKLRAVGGCNVGHMTGIIYVFLTIFLIMLYHTVFSLSHFFLRDS